MRRALLAASMLLLGSLAALAAPAEAITIPVCVGGSGYCERVVCISDQYWECWDQDEGSYGTCYTLLPDYNDKAVCTEYVPLV